MNNVCIPPIPAIVLDTLSPECRASIERLAQHRVPPLDLSSPQPISGMAAVLVLLFEERGTLRVVLTTRSQALRTHAGQTACPGGKVDDVDKNILETAHREAFEEIGLPLNSIDVHDITVLEPFLSLHKLLVFPVVALLTNPALIADFVPSEREVSCIFTHRLDALLEPELVANENLVPIGTDNWPYHSTYHDTTDVVVAMLSNTVYRMHRFRSSASPVKGLTADILIKTAEIAFGRATAYDRYAPGQARGYSALCEVLRPQ